MKKMILAAFLTTAIFGCSPEDVLRRKYPRYEVCFSTCHIIRAAHANDEKKCLAGIHVYVGSEKALNNAKKYEKFRGMFKCFAPGDCVRYTLCEGY